MHKPPQATTLMLGRCPDCELLHLALLDSNEVVMGTVTIPRELCMQMIIIMQQHLQQMPATEH